MRLSPLLLQHRLEPVDQQALRGRRGLPWIGQPDLHRLDRVRPARARCFASRPAGQGLAPRVTPPNRKARGSAPAAVGLGAGLDRGGAARVHAGRLVCSRLAPCFAACPFRGRLGQLAAQGGQVVAGRLAVSPGDRGRVGLNRVMQAGRCQRDEPHDADGPGTKAEFGDRCVHDGSMIAPNPSRRKPTPSAG